MIYEIVKPENGIIRIDANLYQFRISSIRDGWASLQIFNEKGNVESVHDIPVTLDYRKRVKTGGHEYTLIRRAFITKER